MFAKKPVKECQKDMWDLWDVNRVGNWFQPRIIEVKDFLQIRGGGLSKNLVKPWAVVAILK